MTGAIELVVELCFGGAMTRGDGDITVSAGSKGAV